MGQINTLLKQKRKRPLIAPYELETLATESHSEEGMRT